MKNKNIWIFNHYAKTPALPGGTRHFEIGKKLTEKGHEVIIFASNYIHMNFSFIEIEKSKIYKIENFDSLKFMWIKTLSYKKNNLKRFLNMISYCINVYIITKDLISKNIINKPEIIVGSTVHPFAALTAALISKKNRVPFIFEIRDLWPQTFIDMGIWKEESIISKLFKYIEKITVSKANKIIALSPETIKYLIRHYKYPKTNITYIPNGVNVKENIIDNKIFNNDFTLKKLFYLRKKGFFIALFSGSLILTNKLDTVIKAAEKLKTFEKIYVILVGKGTEEERYKGLIKSRKLRNTTIFPPVKKAHVQKLLQFADVLILNQGKVLWGSSNKLYDYLASGKPIIASVYAEHNNVIRKVRAGISIPQGDPQALADATIQFYNMSKEQREEMGKKGRKFVEKYHNIEKLADKFLEVIS